MATRRSSAATNEADNVFIYTVGVEVLKTVTRVRFDPSVRSIPPHAFNGCRDLIEVELNENLQTIYSSAFENCTSLSRIKIPPNVTAIYARAFQGCTSLSVVELSEALETIWWGTFQNCTSLSSIKIPSNVTSIKDKAFQGCVSLSVVELNEALVEIGQRAFMNCKLLLSMKIPPNVTTIDEEAFNECGSLREVHLNNVLNTLGEDALSSCICLPFIRIPGSITMVSSGTFYQCTSLKMVVLNEGTTLIGGDAFGDCNTLLGITIPSTVNSIALDAFKESNLLRNVSISPASNLTQEIFEQSLPTLSNMDITLDMIMHRFDKLPLHKYCYDCYSTRAIQSVANASSEGFNQAVTWLPEHGLNQDCLGMTPLHILACSSNGRGIKVFQCMIDKYPNALLIEDRWGDLPLNYALYAEARIKVINFLFKMHRQMWGDMPFDFGHMIQRVAQFAYPDYLRDVIRAQRAHFPSLAIDWQSLVNTCIVDWKKGIPFVMFRVLVETSVSSRSVCMSEEHRSIIDARVCEFEYENDNANLEEEDDNETERRIVHSYVEIRHMISNYALLYKEFLLEATAILELALWKATILRSSQDNQARTRVECRADAGRCAEVVIKGVLTFL
jgi:hypothetical protein